MIRLPVNKECKGDRHQDDYRARNANYQGPVHRASPSDTQKYSINHRRLAWNRTVFLSEIPVILRKRGVQV
jgi:hypothetical protein